MRTQYVPDPLKMDLSEKVQEKIETKNDTPQFNIIKTEYLKTIESMKILISIIFEMNDEYSFDTLSLSKKMDNKGIYESL